MGFAQDRETNPDGAGDALSGLKKTEQSQIKNEPEVFDKNGLNLVPKRRPDGVHEEFGWFVAPTPVHIEGIGSAIPFFGLLSNIYKTTDIIWAQTIPGGDFDIQVTVFNELPFYTEHLLLTGGKYNNQATLKLFNRGINSDPKDYIIPYVHEKGTFFQAKALFWKQRLRFLYQLIKGESVTKKIFDMKGNLLSSTPSKYSYEGSSSGFELDFTDDPIDPRVGVNFGYKIRPSKADYEVQSDVLLTDTNLSGYLPMFDKDTLVFNLFTSISTITRRGVTDEATAHLINSQNCASSQDQAACQAGEDKLVRDFIAYNKYGATAIGGSNRLRAYPVGRFKAGNASFMALEYRYNFSAEPKKINWYLLGGVETLLQASFFYEQGTVAESRSELSDNMKQSYGIGLRALISGFIYRFDLAIGDEGAVPTIFIDYPMQLNPIAGN
ncbi:MAG: hypothetical protein OEY59_06900 [Deltaproteobacteria bacterium]|nr:hypothetical protein [Deltaproteobacteria bacterium]